MSHYSVMAAIPSETIGCGDFVRRVYSELNRRMEPFCENTEDPDFLVDETGDDGEICKVNPNAQWDWFQVGGRWPGRLRIRLSTADYIPTDCSFMHEMPEDPDGFRLVSGARKKDICWDDMREAAHREYQNRYAHLKNILDGREKPDGLMSVTSEGVCGWDSYPLLFRSETLEEYLDRSGIGESSLYLPDMYAFLNKDGEWHSQGNMGGSGSAPAIRRSGPGIRNAVHSWPGWTTTMCSSHWTATFERRSIMDNRKNEIKRMLQENALAPGDSFAFACDRCGRCCRNRDDILLNPMDLYRMARYLKMTPIQVVDTYCERYQGGDSRIVVIRLAPLPYRRTCPFLAKDGCSVHEAKPTVCAIYPLGRAAAGNHFTYFLQPVDCGRKGEVHTVDEWLHEFHLQSEEADALLWMKTVGRYTLAMHRAEADLDAGRLSKLLSVMCFLFYLNYDTEEPFSPQFAANLSEMRGIFHEITGKEVEA